MPGYNSLKSKFDSSNMFDMISGLSNQIQSSLAYMEDWTLKKKYSQIDNVLIMGMGGSAIGGDFVAAVLEQDCEVPIIINRSYDIPNWVDEKTLVIASSYSGNTEETLSSFEQAVNKNAQIICVTTGGELFKKAINSNLDIVEVPQGLQPRAAVGYSFTLNLLLLAKLGLTDYKKTKENLNKSVKNLIIWQSEFQKIEVENTAMEISNKIKDTYPIIYTATGWTGVCALRFRGQLAENSKMLSSHFIFPEQNHNEIEGWTCNPEIMGKMAIIWLNDEDDHKQIKKRKQISNELLQQYPSEIIDIKMEGNSPIERMLKMIHFLDWVSYYTALLNGVDPTPVNRITELKSKLVDK